MKLFDRGRNVRESALPIEQAVAAARAPELVPLAEPVVPPSNPTVEADAVRASFPVARQPDVVAVHRMVRLRELLYGRALDDLSDEEVADVAARFGLTPASVDQQLNEGNVPDEDLRAALRHVLNGTLPDAS